ncbi:MAG: GNAT family N-acetyltransferase [Proteobacteria bacterium]|nr:GNAT family N-acetyltransferase [Pseudomonadota bacterium]MBI3496593.1 GNAT family N-acetyltransferase [Pseudomonadota bacterium]
MQVIRPLVPIEASSMREHFLRLRDEDRYLRFGGPAREGMVDRYLAGIDWTHSIRLGCFLDATLRGLAELVRSGEHAAELALTVEAPFQHRGIASDLLRRVLVLARNRGVRQIISYCLADNQNMRGLVRKFTGRIEFDGANAAAHFSTGVANPLSFWHESVQSANGLVGSLAQQLIGRGQAAAGGSEPAPKPIS